MSTERRIRASQQNGARSRGPKTAEGKRRSSRNAIRHGLLSNTVVLEDEDALGFRNLLRSLESEFMPETPAETALVENLAVARWRLMRVWALEKESLNLEIQKHDPDAYNPRRTRGPRLSSAQRCLPITRQTFIAMKRSSTANTTVRSICCSSIATKRITKRTYAHFRTVYAPTAGIIP